jgi:thioesterase domain-containing protein
MLPVTAGVGEATSFYAAAYQDASGNIVISYRGTDAPHDVVTGWTGGAGFQTRQAELAAQFYHQVKQAYPDATITLTGHSLGGGLARWPGARRVPLPKAGAGCGASPG